jgi:hypothetical protein
MKKVKNVKIGLYAMLLVVLLVSLSLTACASYTYDVSGLSPLSTGELENESLANLSESIFIGEGERIRGGGDTLTWYYWAFGFWFHNIPEYFMNAVGQEAFHGWTRQFHYGYRDGRTAHLRTLVEDFGITMQDIINSMEYLFGMPMHEIDARINWARYGTHASTYEELEAQVWAIQHSLSDLEALFSNDVYAIWTAFPGYGVFYNGRVYSPEWIMQNINEAITDEQIPLQEIMRIIDMTVYHPDLDEMRINATSIFQAELSALSSYSD